MGERDRDERWLYCSKSEYERRMTFARQEAAKAWCAASTSSIEMDVALAEEFARILLPHMYAAHLGCATTGELLDEISARVDREYSTISAPSCPSGSSATQGESDTEGDRSNGHSEPVHNIYGVTPWTCVCGYYNAGPASHCACCMRQR